MESWSSKCTILGLKKTPVEKSLKFEKLLSQFCCECSQTAQKQPPLILPPPDTHVNLSGTPFSIKQNYTKEDKLDLKRNKSTF